MPSEPWRAFLQLLCYCFCCLAIMMGKLYIRYLTPCQHKDQQAVLSMWDLWARTWQEACPTPPLEGLSGSCSVPECNLQHISNSAVENVRCKALRESVCRKIVWPPSLHGFFLSVLP